MEMPELNEDILGESNAEVLNQTGSTSGNLDDPNLQAEGQVPENIDAPQEKLDEGEAGEKVAGQQEENEDTIDDLDLPKEEPMPGVQSADGGLAEMADEKQDEDEDEPAKKKQKLDNQDQAIAEQLQQLDQQSQPQQQELDQHSEGQTPAEDGSEFQPEGGEQQEMMDVDKHNEEAGKVLLNKDGEKQGAGPDTDMLATLASAALEQDPKDKAATGGTTPKSPVVKNDPDTPKKKPEMWCNVGVFDTNTTIVSDYLATPETNDNVDLVTATLGGRRIQLEPGTAYKFRVCAVNGCGTGPWSDVAAFKTTLPGYPGAPSAIKISKSPEGAHLTWEPPGGNSGDILEYAVYLAVRSASQGCQPVTTNQAQLAFVRVFCGPTNKCMVGTNSLQAAHIDTTTKPAIIFRIAAKNSKGYGPATQVRWLQESQNGTTPGPKRAVKS